MSCCDNDKTPSKYWIEFGVLLTIIIAVILAVVLTPKPTPKSLEEIRQDRQVRYHEAGTDIHQFIKGASGK